MFGQDLSRKKMYPTAMKVNPPGTEIVRSDLFICLETVSLSLVSAQEGCLTSLRCLPSLRSGRQLLRSVRQLPSFSTTAESETVSRQIKSVLTSVLSLGFTFLGSRNIYSLYYTSLLELSSHGASFFLLSAFRRWFLLKRCASWISVIAKWTFIRLLNFWT